MKNFTLFLFFGIIAVFSSLHAQETTIDLTKNETFMKSLREWLTENNSEKATILRLEIIVDSNKKSVVLYVGGHPFIIGNIKFSGALNDSIEIPASLKYGLEISYNSKTRWKTNNSLVCDDNIIGIRANGVQAKLNSFIAKLNTHLIDSLNNNKITLENK